MNSFLDYIFFGNTVRNWGIALGILVIGFILAKLIRIIVVSRIRKLSEKSKTTFDDLIVVIIDKALLPLAFVYSFYAGFRYLTMPPRVTRIIHVAILAVTIFFIVRAISAVISYFFLRYSKARTGSDSHAPQAKGILAIVQMILWLLAVVFLIDNLGYDITTIVAGLGIGGIAIALAAQTILGDLFSYLVIFFDKPFEIGDFIIVGDKMGTVEYVGIKSTKIRALSGEQLILSNTDLTNSRIQNYKRMQVRRIVFSFGVEYDTKPEKLKSIPEIVKRIIQGEEKAQIDRVHFANFGDSSLNFEAVYNVLSADYNLYMDIQQRINLAIFQSFRDEDIRFAYPTQRLLFDDGNGAPNDKQGSAIFTNSRSSSS
jgi:small-conductance mechanosensitive channel